MVREKQSSTISTRVGYEQALKAGYRPALLDPAKTMHSLAWDAVKDHANVKRTGSGKSIILTGQSEFGTIELMLKTKGMLSVAEVEHFGRAGVEFPLP